MSRAISDLVGKRFGRLTVIEFTGVRRPNNNPRMSTSSHWRCKCDCGNDKITKISSLNSGGCSSCGCLQKEVSGLKQTPILERFYKYVLIIPMTDCHFWIGSVDRNGYGIVSYNRKSTRTHRVSYTIYRGEIPNGLHVLHNCDNRLCVNPDHLRLGTNTDNIRDKSMRFNFKSTPAMVKSIREDLKATTLSMACPW